MIVFLVKRWEADVMRSSLRLRRSPLEVNIKGHGVGWVRGQGCYFHAQRKSESRYACDALWRGEKCNERGEKCNETLVNNENGFSESAFKFEINKSKL